MKRQSKNVQGFVNVLLVTEVRKRASKEGVQCKQKSEKHSAINHERNKANRMETLHYDAGLPDRQVEFSVRRRKHGGLSDLCTLIDAPTLHEVAECLQEFRGNNNAL